jgi:DNA-binding IclR family transcriptional regulator
MLLRARPVAFREMGLDQSASRALAILESLAHARGPARLKRIADEVGIQKSTVHRILQTLIALGYAEQDPETGHYAPSLKLWELGTAVAFDHPIRRAASGFLQALHHETGETVSLLVRSGDDVLYLEKLVSPRPVRFSVRPGSRVPAPLTAGGRAILAQAADAREVVARLAARASQYRPHDPAAILEELDLARQRGYSVSHDNPGVLALGCALPVRAGAPATAISVSAPEERLSEGSERQLAEALMATCAKLSDSIGPV